MGAENMRSPANSSEINCGDGGIEPKINTNGIDGSWFIVTT